MSTQPTCADFRKSDDLSKIRERLANRVRTCMHNSPTPATTDAEGATACFASHGSYGIVDLGATKTVIGSELVPDLLKHLQPEVLRQVKRCPCTVTLRFGNQGVLQSKQALVVPIHGMLLKIAIPGNTPFLLSNTLLRALEASVDTAKHVLFAAKINKSFPMTLTGKGLFLLDINDLAQPSEETIQSFKMPETHTTVCSQPEPPIADADQPGHAKECRHRQSFKCDDQMDENDDDAMNVIKGQGLDENARNQFESPRSNAVSQPCQHADSHVHSHSTSSCIERSKSVPRSFQVIRRDGHVHVWLSVSSRSSSHLPSPRWTPATTPRTSRRRPGPSPARRIWARRSIICGATNSVGCCGSLSITIAARKGSTECFSTFLYYVDKKIERCELSGIRMPVTGALTQDRKAPAEPKMRAGRPELFEVVEESHAAEQ